MAFQTNGYLNEDGKVFLNVTAFFYAQFRLRIMGFICSIYTVFYSVSFFPKKNQAINIGSKLRKISL